MSGSYVNTIAHRLSLRRPQRVSLEILDRVCDIISLEKTGDLAQDLSVIQSEFPSVSDFERDFPSLCFALATGKRSLGSALDIGQILETQRENSGFSNCGESEHRGLPMWNLFDS